MFSQAPELARQQIPLWSNLFGPPGLGTKKHSGFSNLISKAIVFRHGEIEIPGTKLDRVADHSLLAEPVSGGRGRQGNPSKR